MAELTLRRLITTDESAFVRAFEEWDTNPGFTWSRDYQPGMNFSKYIELLNQNEKGLQLAPGLVLDTSLFAFLDSEIVGRVSLRHELNDLLFQVGGHIGYGVLPRFRRRGFATQMLKLTLPLAKQIGIHRVLVTCDENNLGSIKIIEASGGILENVINVDENKPAKCRYWIQL